ncbi:MAG: ACP S-malonyltransferase [Actinobacteria bacterium]|nr:ACP S-malonyltransferase [Actinomycetota bacterium]
MSIAALFPGQGSQAVGMADPWLSHPAGKTVIEEASDAWGRDVVALCNDEVALSTTEVVQPAVFACDVAAFRVLQAEGIEVAAAAGHSLGEFAALVAAGALELGPALRTVIIRGEAMQAASDAEPSTMTAILGLSSEEAAELCEIAGRGDVLQVANENAPSQVVLSGTVAAIERAEELARTRNAKAIRLKVAGAFHSPLMKPALAKVRESIAGLSFSQPEFAVIPNVSGRPTTEPSALRDLLSRQMTSPVRWETTMHSAAEIEVTKYVELGPGGVLTKLARRCIKGADATAVGSPEDVAAFAAAVREAE